MKFFDNLVAITALLLSLVNAALANQSSENIDNYAEAESLQTQLIQLLEVDPLLELEKIKLTQAASHFLLQNKQELLEKITAYKGKFKYNRYWFLSPQPRLTSFSTPDVDLDFLFVFSFNCKNCIRMGDLLRHYRQYGSLKKQTTKIHLTLIPTMFVDNIVHLSLKSVAKNEEELLEMNNRMVFDFTYNKLDINKTAHILNWIKKNTLNLDPISKNLDNNTIQNEAKRITGELDQLKEMTVPMTIINNKFVLFKNIVHSSSDRAYNDDLSAAVLDYVATLALLEKHNVLFFKPQKTLIIK